MYSSTTVRLICRIRIRTGFLIFDSARRHDGHERSAHGHPGPLGGGERRGRPPQGGPEGGGTARAAAPRWPIGNISAKFSSIWAVSAPIFARKYAFCSIFQNLQDYLADFFENSQN